MPRLPTVRPETAIACLKKHKHEIISGGKIAVPTNEIWTTIAKEISGDDESSTSRINPKTLYTLVRNNRYNVWEEIGYSEDQETTSFRSNSVEYENWEDDTSMEAERRAFTITISTE